MPFYVGDWVHYDHGSLHEWYGGPEAIGVVEKVGAKRVQIRIGTGIPLKIVRRWVTPEDLYRRLIYYPLIDNTPPPEDW